jgi:hypothetical protein
MECALQGSRGISWACIATTVTIAARHRRCATTDMQTPAKAKHFSELKSCHSRSVATKIQ